MAGVLSPPFRFPGAAVPYSPCPFSILRSVFPRSRTARPCPGLSVLAAGFGCIRLVDFDDNLSMFSV